MQGWPNLISSKQWIHESLTTEENIFLIDIIIKLLSLIPRGDEPRYSTWEHKLCQEVAIRSSLGGWPEDVSFWHLEASAKARIIVLFFVDGWMFELKFNESAAFDFESTIGMGDK